MTLLSISVSHATSFDLGSIGCPFYPGAESDRLIKNLRFGDGTRETAPLAPMNVTNRVVLFGATAPSNVQETDPDVRAFLAGEPLRVSAKIRSLAQRAFGERNETSAQTIEEWSQRLAKDFSKLTD
jgi:hypothetical protein